MIHAANLIKNFQSFRAVNGVSFDVPAGVVYAFLGPNGAGKTTTIRMLTGILEPDEGQLELFGLNYRKHRNEILNLIGYIPDRPFLYGKMTAIELLRFLGSLRKLDPNYVKQRSMDLLDKFRLADFAHEIVERYSHGMRQKLVMATALLHKPQLLVVDEPMVGLDPRAALQIKQLITDFAKSGRSVFMSTHTLEVAAQLCDRVGIIHKGSVVADESLASLTERMKTKDGDLEAVFMALTADGHEPEAIPV